MKLLFKKLKLVELNKRWYFFSTIVLTSTLLSCSVESKNKTCSLPFDIPPETNFIGHKGSGPIGQHNNPEWHENGSPSVLNALKKTDGTEIDIQMSLDSTLWLFHDHTILSCNDTLINISLLNDSMISSISDCNFNNQLITLDEFNTLLGQYKLNKKHISLDLKVLSNPEIVNEWEEDSLVTYVFEQIHQTLKAGNVVLEIPQNISYKNAISHSKLEIYQVFYDKKSVPKEEAEHISVPFNVFTELNSNHKKSQLWTTNKLSEMITAMQETPNYIQSDNVPLASFISKMRNKKTLNCLPSVEIKKNGMNDEYIKLIEDQQLPEKSSIVHLDLSNSNLTGEQFFVLSVKNSDGGAIYWEAINLINEHPFLFLDHTISTNDNATYSVYIWNKLKTPVTLSGKLNVYQK